MVTSSDSSGNAESDFPEGGYTAADGVAMNEEIINYMSPEKDRIREQWEAMVTSSAISSSGTECEIQPGGYDAAAHVDDALDVCPAKDKIRAEWAARSPIDSDAQLW